MSGPDPAKGIVFCLALLRSRTQGARPLSFLCLDAQAHKRQISRHAAAPLGEPNTAKRGTIMSIANILTIAGSDSGGGAGIQADLKTIMAMGCYGMSAITALTAQNGLGVRGIYPASAEFMDVQLKAIFEGFPVHAAKTGMLFNAELIHVVAQNLAQKDFPLVVDPVSVSQSGSRLLQEDAVDALVRELLPLADLLTPNIPEAEMLSGMKICDQESQAQAGQKILALGPRAVLVKGGHMEHTDVVLDILCLPNDELVFLTQKAVDTSNNHGTGCTLSAAIAAGLGKGEDRVQAIRNAQAFLNRALAQSYAPGLGCGPVNHAAGIVSVLD